MKHLVLARLRCPLVVAFVAPGRPMPGRLAVGAALVLALTAAGCTRARPSPSPVVPGAASAPLTAPVAAPTAAVALVAPAAGNTLTSPVAVVASADLAAGRTLAAQVYSRAADGGLTWRGNGRMTGDGSGRFTGAVTYTLPASSPGVLELVVVDTADNHVVQRHSTEIVLSPAP